MATEVETPPKRHRALNGRTAPPERARVRISAADLVEERKPVLEFENADGETEVYQGIVWGTRMTGETEVAVLAAWYLPQADQVTGVLAGDPGLHRTRMEAVVILLVPDLPRTLLARLKADELTQILQDLNFLRPPTASEEQGEPVPPEGATSTT